MTFSGEWSTTRFEAYQKFQWNQGGFYFRWCINVALAWILAFPNSTTDIDTVTVLKEAEKSVLFNKYSLFFFYLFIQHLLSFDSRAGRFLLEQERTLLSFSSLSPRSSMLSQDSIVCSESSFRRCGTGVRTAESWKLNDKRAIRP